MENTEFKKEFRILYICKMTVRQEVVQVIVQHDV